MVRRQRAAIRGELAAYLARVRFGAFAVGAWRVWPLSEVWVELRGGPASYTIVEVYRDNGHRLPPTVEVLVAGGVLDYRLTSAVTAPDGYPIYRCPTNWRLAVRPAAPVPTVASPGAPGDTVAPPAAAVDPLDALLAALDAKDAEGPR